MGGGDGLGCPGAEPPGAGFWGALAFSSGDPPHRGTRQTSAGEGEAGGRGYARGLVAVARKQWGGEDGGVEVGGRRAHTRAEEEGERAGERARALGGARAGGGPRRRDRVGAACAERVSRSGAPTPGSGERTPASPGSRAPSRRSRQAPGLRAALLRPPSGKRGWSPSGSPGGEGGRGRGRERGRDRLCRLGLVTARMPMPFESFAVTPGFCAPSGSRREKAPPPPLHPCHQPCFASPQE